MGNYFTPSFNRIDFVIIHSDIKLPCINPISLGDGGGGALCPTPVFSRCILTGGTLKLILYDFSSNFILNM